MFKSTCLSLLFLLLFLGSPFCLASTFPPGDLDYDAKIDFEDIAILSQQWLKSGCQRDSLRNHWKFDERTANLAYDSAGNNIGIISGGKWTEGRIESGISFDGESFVDINDIMLTSNWSISFWIYNKKDTGTVIFGDNTKNGDYFYILNNSKIKFCNSESNSAEWSDDVDLYKKWRFVTLVSDTNSVELFLDGISQGTKELLPAINITKIGTGHTNPSYDFVGTIDDFRIYDEALNVEQIQLLNRTGTTISNCADIDNSSSIDMDDFSQLAGYWKKEFGPVVINEFMASNETCVADEYGNYPDWIELYNPTNTPFNVGGMHLSDADTIWQIPDNNPDKTTINPHCYLLIWADKSPELGTLHANFKLGAGGESVILYESDRTTIVDSINFGPQTTDVSFGRFPDLSDNWKLFSQPTPGKTNGLGYSGISKSVDFSVKSKCFTEPFTIELTTTQEDADIYYTLDGEFPDQTSAKYTEPIDINETTIIRAMAKSKDMASSDVKSETYIQLAPEIADFNSNLPLFIVESFGDRQVNSSDNEEYIYNTSVFINTNENERTYLTDPAEYFGRSGIRVRGSSTAGTAKHQYAFETWDEYNEDKNVSIFGLPSESDWVVHGPYSDKTLMRNYLVYKWSNEIGQYAPRVVYMEGFINVDGGPVSMEDYVGVYYFMEKIKRDKNRVNIEKLTPYDNDEPVISGGYILKNDRADPDDPVTISSQMGSLRFVEPKSEELNDAQKTYITDYIHDFEFALSAYNFDDPENGYAKYADPNSFIDSQILVELAKNIDGYRLSTFMYKDRGGRLKMGPAWDYNLSLGNANYNTGWTPVGWYYPLTPTAYTWYSKMFLDIEFYMDYIDRWFSLRKGKFETNSLMDEIDATAAYLEESQQRNFERWKNIDVYSWPNPGWGYGDETEYNNPPLTYPEHINFMKNWLKGRVEWMDSQFIAPPVFNKNGGEVETGFELTMKVSDIPTITKFIDTNDLWKYMDDGSNLKVAWRETIYNDSHWFEGNSPFGYGEGDENTIIDYGPDPNNKFITTYFRNTFEIEDINRVQSLTLKLLCDDGAAIYLNDDLLQKFNLPTSGRLLHTTLAASEIEGEDENNYIIYELDPSILNEGTNYIAVEIHQASSDSNDMSFDLILEGITGRCLNAGKIYYTTDNSDPRLRGGYINPTATEYTKPISITENTLIKARELDEQGQWSAINNAPFATTNISNALRITEIMYHPADNNNPDDPNTEFIELTNTTKSPINLNMVHFREGVNFTFNKVYLNGGEYIVVVKDIDAFTAKYGNKINIAGQYTGSLDNAGERIKLTDALDNTILDFEYKDGWYPSTDGLGSSLVIRNQYNNDVNSWGEKESWMPSSNTDGNPGRKDDSNLPIPGAIVINEILSNPASGQCDWIELHNTTNEAIDIGGWFISDNDEDFMKYEIPESTILPAGGYTVFYESIHFGNSAAPGCHTAFGLSSKGETVFLLSGKDGQLSGYYYEQKFDAAITATTFGLHVKSTGDCDFVAMSQPTPAEKNAYPKVGPVIFSKIMYHPQYSSDAEFILLYNISNYPVALQAYDSESHTNIPWAFISGIEFTFPLNTVIPVRGYLVIAKNPETFNSLYGPTSIPVLGPFDKELSNSGEKVELAMPTSDFDNNNQRIYITMEHIEYEDKNPWPPEADGKGYMLFKRPLRNYSNDPVNWQALK